jgi:hypothetical protein
MFTLWWKTFLLLTVFLGLRVLLEIAMVETRNLFAAPRLLIFRFSVAPKFFILGRLGLQHSKSRSLKLDMLAK